MWKTVVIFNFDNVTSVLNVFLIGTHSMQGSTRQPLREPELQEKEAQKY